MLRSLYSGISGLKVHQTRMDVIGNNIANVNTTGFKSSTVNFSDILYQTTVHAKAANLSLSEAGQNAQQIGLGSTVSSIKSTVTTQGGSQRTDNSLDLMINGDAFLVVNSNGTNYFTKNGEMTIDGDGNLSSESGGLIMGWGVDPENAANIIQDEVSPIKVYSADNLYAEPEPTTDAYFKGNIDQNDIDLENGKVMQMEFYDKIGNKYTARFSLTQQDTIDKNEYNIALTDIVGSDGVSFFLDAKTANGITTYSAKVPSPTISFAGSDYTIATDANGNPIVDATTGAFSLSPSNGVAEMIFNASSGKFVSIGSGTTIGDNTTLSISTGIAGATSSENLFEDIAIDFSALSMYENAGNSSITGNRGNVETGLGAGAPTGSMTGVSVGTDGKIYVAYDNGNTKLIGQIAVANFTNPSGLEAIGSGLFKTTPNSGQFDGVGRDITSLGIDFSVGVLEMSNVDLATEFTNMITTQRGFQANSKIITTSDTLLEELINLKR